MIQLVSDVRHQTHELIGLAGHLMLGVGVLMLVVSFLGGRFQSDKVTKAAIMIAGGAILMNFAEAYL